MVRARKQFEWTQTASLMSMIHNVNCTKSYDRRPASAFMPPGLTARPVKQKAPPPTAEERELLRKVFPGKKQG